MTKIFITIMLISVNYSQAVHAVSYSEQDLQTLFTTPSEREALNTSQRDDDQLISNDSAYYSPPKVHINGIVSRGDGKSVVWMNGKNTMKNSMIDGVKVYSNAMNSSNKIPILIDGKKVMLKPGESWQGDVDISKNDF